jgi:hypothetical protein
MPVLSSFPKNFLALFFTILLAHADFGQATKTVERHVNAKAALHIAEAELVRVYGKTVRAERPFTAKMENGTWTVVGTERCEEQLPAPDFYCPGSHWAKISKDGRVLSTGAQQAYFQ